MILYIYNWQTQLALRGAERDQQHVISKECQWADVRSAGFAARTSHVTRFRCVIHGVLHLVRSLPQHSGMPTASAIVGGNLGLESAGSALQVMLQAEHYA